MKDKEPTIDELHSRVEPASLPKHVAIIMDGNGRWAVRRGMPRVAGHKRGAETVRAMTEFAREIGLGALTLYAFSDENWGRPSMEVRFLMEMLERYLRAEVPSMKKNGIRFRAIGRMEKMPSSARAEIDRAIAETAGNTGMFFTLALSYGGRGEIVAAIKRMAAAGVRPEDLTEDVFADLLDTRGLPDPDLIIRTSGEQRISNFLLWQSAYAELYFTDTLWPDFDERAFLLALLDYQGRQRRFGLTGEQLVRKQ